MDLDTTWAAFYTSNLSIFVAAVATKSTKAAALWSILMWCSPLSPVVSPPFTSLSWTSDSCSWPCLHNHCSHTDRRSESVLCLMGDEIAYPPFHIFKNCYGVKELIVIRNGPTIIHRKNKKSRLYKTFFITIITVSFGEDIYIVSLDIEQTSLMQIQI